MVERYRRARGKRKLLGNHQKCWVWGRNLVLEALRSGRWLPIDLLLADSAPDDVSAEVRSLAENQDVPVSEVSAAVIRQKCHTSEHQGLAARMPEFPYYDSKYLTSLLANVSRPLLLLCDRIQDPYNLGAIVRSAEALGVTAVVLGTREQTGVTSLVARASAGAVVHVPIVQVESMEGCVSALRSDGIVLAGCSEKASQAVYDCDLSGPAGLVIGNEGTGIRPAILEQLDYQLSIPQSGTVSSLNAAAAAAIALYEVSRQRARNG